MSSNAAKLLKFATDFEKKAASKEEVASRGLQLITSLRDMLQVRLNSLPEKDFKHLEDKELAEGLAEQRKELRYVIQTQIDYLDEIGECIKVLASQQE